MNLAGRLPFQTRNLAAAIRLAGLLAGLALAAWWIAHLVSPRPVAVLPVSAEPVRAGAHDEAIARVFGMRPADAGTSLGGLSLTGVFAETGSGAGFATFRTAKGGVGVAVGEEVRPGIRLERLEPTRAIVRAGGREHVLELPQSGPPPAAERPAHARD